MRGTGPRSATVLSAITPPKALHHKKTLLLCKKKKKFSNFTFLKREVHSVFLKWKGGAGLRWWGKGGFADELYVFTNGVAGISAAMATNHMTRCIRLPQTGCSEAWCEHAALHLSKSCPCLAGVFVAPPPPPHPFSPLITFLTGVVWRRVQLTNVLKQTERVN